MKITVIVRHLPDLIESLTVDSSQTSLDLSDSSFIINEYDNHALEQGLILKEQLGGTVTVVALDFGEIDQTLFAAAAKGADRICKIAYGEEYPPNVLQSVKLYAEALRSIEPDLVMIGVQAYDELDGILASFLAEELKFPYAGLLQGVEKGKSDDSLTIYKEYPGASKAKMSIQLPAVLGILTASQPPRYVPISRIRTVMKTAVIEELDLPIPDIQPGVQIVKLYLPEVGERAEMIEGDATTIASTLVRILQEKGVLK